MDVEKKEDHDDNEEEQAGDPPVIQHNDDAEAEAAIPESKFQPKQRVYAKDSSSGLWYDAVIRRSLYGVNNNKQVQIGLVCSESEISDILEQAAKEPMWHYFVHYNQWAVNWDRWVSEEDIIECTEESKQIAQRYAQEHKELQKEIKKTKGKKSDGAAFLKAWRKRMDKIEEDMKKEEEEKKKAGTAGNQESAPNKDEKPATETASEAKPKPKPKPKKKKKVGSEKVWDEGSLEREHRLQLRGLESKRTSQDQHKMALPFSLKKVMVEAWEIITQCEMVPNLPASVTVRQVLDKYLKSKLDLIDASLKKSAAAATPVEGADTANETSTVGTAGATTSDDKDPVDDAKAAEAEENRKKLDKKKQEWTDMVEGISMFFDDALGFRLLYSQELPQFKVVESTFVVPIEDAATNTVGDENKNDAHEKDIEHGDLMKDEKMPNVSDSKPEDTKTDDVPTKTENVQSSATTLTDSKDEKANISQNSQDATETAKSSKAGSGRKSKSSARNDGNRPMLPCEVYGCEHLLRLCLKIPDLLAEQLPKLVRGDEVEVEAIKAYEVESKQILAKVSDLIRFLHKHQSTMFADSYRKMNEAELREEQKWARYIERKRKRALEEKEEATAAATTKQEDAATGGTLLNSTENDDTTDGTKQKLQKVS